MRTALLWTVACCCAAAVVLAQEQSPARTFHIAWSTRDVLKKQDWSGSARIGAGRITAVVNDSGAQDTVHPDMSWTIVYGRSLQSDPTTRPREKGLWITVEAPDDAVLTVTTKGGEFSFGLGEVSRQGIERLEGNVRITRAPRGPRRQQAGGSRQQQVSVIDLPDALAGELPAERISAPDRQSQWPALAVTAGETLWAAYVQWNGKNADDIVVARRQPNASGWQTKVLPDRPWDHYCPAIVARDEGALVVWSAQTQGNFDLYAAELSPSGRVRKRQQLTDAPFTDYNARMAADADGNVTLVWQSSRSGDSDIYARRLVGSRWSDEIRVPTSNANDWEPAVALDSTGDAWIVWDSYETGDYNVFLRRLGGTQLGDVIAVTTEPTAQFHSTVAIDSQDRVWVAWDDGGENWSKDFSRASSAPGSRGMHASRSLGVRVFAGGALSEPEADLSEIMVGRMQRFAELPHLAFDGSGTLWMVFRHWTSTAPAEVFHFYATRLTADGWEKPWLLGNSSGQNTEHASFARAPGGPLMVAYASDGRAPDNFPTGQLEAFNYNTYVAELSAGEAAGAPSLGEVTLPESGIPGPRRPRYTKTIGDKTYTLVWGDCHRHTDIRGHSGVDGSALDSYRYALDAAPLDFMGLGDHNQVTALNWPDGLRNYSWWWTQKAADLMHAPPFFVGIYSYEHSLSRPSGHRNVLFLKRGGPLRLADRSKDSADNLPPNMWKWMEENALTQPGQKIVIVPHTFASGPLADWNWPNARFDCLLEIYQGCRGSYEAWGLPPGEKRGPTQTQEKGHFAQDALDVGNRYGFVSFSDHGSTHNSFACVWAESVSREGILDAMLARRTYAATDEIYLDVTADGRMAGEEFPAAEPPTIKADIAAPDTILRVDVVKDGRYVWTNEPNAREFTFSYRDADAQPGTSYYYVRVFQRDPEAPDGDPEIAWASPFFVEYQ